MLQKKAQAIPLLDIPWAKRQPQSAWMGTLAPVHFQIDLVSMARIRSQSSGKLDLSTYRGLSAISRDPMPERDP